MLKLKKSEVSMKAKRILKTICLALASLLGIIGLSSLASAADTITIGENADDGPSSFQLAQEIKYESLNISGGVFEYSIVETDGLNAVANLPSAGIVLPPLSQKSMTQNITLDFSETTVPATPAVYNMALTIVAAPEDLNCNNEISYTFDIVVQNARDADYQPTDGYVAFLANLQRNVSGSSQATKVDMASFLCYNDFVPKKYSYTEIKNAVEGKDSSEKDVFKYELLIEGSADDVYTILPPEGEYTYGGKTVQSDTEAIPGKVAVFYLRHGESAIIGKNADGEGEILVGLKYSCTQYSDVDGYTTWINDKAAGERAKIEKTVYEKSGDNEILFMNRREFESPIEKFVNTGLKIGNGAFAILGAIAIVCVVVMLLVRSKRKT
jgi:hypothetical protein